MFLLWWGVGVGAGVVGAGVVGAGGTRLIVMLVFVPMVAVLMVWV